MPSFREDPLQHDSDVQSEIDHVPESDPIRLVVIPCTGSKLPEPAPARFLYTGATFPAALEAAHAIIGRTDGSVMILSALHGLVDPWQELAPYDVKMGDELAIDADTNGRPGILKLAEQLADELKALASESDSGVVEIVLLLPKAYRAAFETALLVAHHGHSLPEYTVRNLYEGARGIGDQKSVCRRISAGELRV